MRKTSLAVLILSLIQINSFAQNSTYLSFSSVFPTGDLKHDSPALWGGGINLDMLFQIKESPIYVGFMGNLNVYGRESQDLILPSEFGDEEVIRTNYLTNALVKFRYKPQIQSRIRPYLDFATGITILHTSAQFHSVVNNECPTDVELILSDNSFVYGLGGGFEYKLAGNLILDISASALQGSNVDYHTPSSLEYNQAADSYVTDIRTSRLEFMMVNIGIRFPFVSFLD